MPSEYSLAHMLRMISAQTRSAFVARKSRCLFSRIMRVAR
jgi:hypothetical protein